MLNKSQKFWTKVDEVDKGGMPAKKAATPLETILEDSGYSDTVNALHKMQEQLNMMKVNNQNNPGAINKMSAAIVEYQEALQELRQQFETITLSK